MKILICSDGSSQADKAICLATAIAEGCRAEVTLLGITEATLDTHTIFDALKRGQQLLEAKKIPAELINKSGDPVDEIMKRTEEARYDLVVIGAVRKGRRGPFWMSTKAYQIVKRIKPPVLIVIGQGSTTIKRILICSGGSKYTESAVALAGQIAQGMGATISLLHVMPETPAIYAGLYRREVDVTLVLNSNSELGRNLRREKEILESLGIPTEVLLRQGPVLEEIFKEIRGGHYDLVVTGSSLSAGPLSTYVLGDITRQIVNHADRPVLVVRRGEKTVSLGESIKAIFFSE